MLPIRDIIPSRTPPIVMWAIMAANIGIFLIQLGFSEDQLRQLFYLLGLVPKRFTHPSWAVWAGFPADDYWPFLTHMFLHGGWLHIISNMWTLWIFGDNVEDRMGHGRFLLFYLLCGIAASTVHLMVNPDSTVPVVGASGAISGILAAYVFLFPYSRIICMVPIFFYPIFFELYAFVFVLVWFWSQFLIGIAALVRPEHLGGIAWEAHLGGFATGAIMYRLFTGRKPRRRPMFQDEYGIEGAWWKR